MGKLSYEDLMGAMNYTCVRCSAECTKTDPLEPILGYVSKVDGSVVAPICQECYNIIPEDDRKPQKHLAAAFIVAIKSDGLGYAILTEGIEIPYLRDATLYEMKSACQDIIDDVNGNKLFTNIISILKSSSQQKQSSNIVPMAQPIVRKRK